MSSLFFNLMKGVGTYLKPYLPATFFLPPLVETPPFKEEDWKAMEGSSKISSGVSSGASGEVPPIPAAVLERLEQPCPFWPSKKVKETHLLFFVPAKVGNRPVTTQNLKEILNSSSTSSVKEAADYFSLSEASNYVVEKSYWALMTKRALPESSHLSYQSQVKKVEQQGGYHVPYALEIALCIVAHYLKTEKPLYCSTGSFSIGGSRCSDLGDVSWPYCIGCSMSGEGSYASLQLSVERYDWDCPKGVAAIQRFPVSSNVESSIL